MSPETVDAVITALRDKSNYGWLRMDDLPKVFAALEATHEWQEMKALELENVELREVLGRHGFRRCDSPIRNCGEWHHIGGYGERFREIDTATIDYWRNGEVLLARVERIVEELEELRARSELPVDPLEVVQ